MFYYKKLLVLGLSFFLFEVVVQAEDSQCEEPNLCKESTLTLNFEMNEEADHIIIINPEEEYDPQDPQFVLPYDIDDVQYVKEKEEWFGKWGKHNISQDNYKFLFVPNINFKSDVDYNPKVKNRYLAQPQYLKKISDNEADNEKFSFDNFIQVWTRPELLEQSKEKPKLTVGFSEFKAKPISSFDKTDSTLPNKNIELFWTNSQSEHDIITTHPEDNEITLGTLDSEISTFILSDMGVNISSGTPVKKYHTYISKVTWTITQAP